VAIERRDAEIRAAEAEATALHNLLEEIKRGRAIDRVA
jgi:hypothetical protein